MKHTTLTALLVVLFVHSSIQAQTIPAEVPYSVPGHFNPADGTSLGKSYDSVGGDNFYATEQRFFLASHEFFLPDANAIDCERSNSWATIDNTNYEPQSMLPLKLEAEFKLAANGFILKDLGQAGGIGESYIDVNRGNTDKIYPSFIFRAEGGSGTILELHFRLKFQRFDANGDLNTLWFDNNETSGDGDHETHLELLFPIDYSLYTEGLNRTDESETLTKFPSPFYTDPVTGKYPQLRSASFKNYAIVDYTNNGVKGIDLQGYLTTLNNRDNLKGWEFKGFDCWVKKTAAAKLFVRGLRIRSDSR